MLNAAATEGTRRPISIALMPVRETPDRRASSSCDQLRAMRLALTRLLSTPSADIANLAACSDYVSASLAS